MILLTFKTPKVLMKKKHCYARHRNDVGKISTPFQFRLKLDAKLQTQRPALVSIHYLEKPKTSMDDF